MFNLRGVRRHLRLCFGILNCSICGSIFPCDNALCPWRFPDQPTVPIEFVPYLFKRPWGNKRRPGKPTDPEVMALALRWREQVVRLQEFLACSDDPKPDGLRPTRLSTY